MENLRSATETAACARGVNPCSSDPGPMPGRGGVTALLSRCYDTAAQGGVNKMSRLAGATGTHG